MENRKKANEVLEELLSGNKRFYEGRPKKYQVGEMTDLQAHLEGQSPFAVVLGCSDSRVPVEMIFDQSIGDLFVIRVAGNVADRTQIGSVEYGLEVLGAPLLMVLGHSGCGAVTAAWQAHRNGQLPDSPHLQSILQLIMPVINKQSQIETRSDSLPDGLVRQNVLATMEELLRQSEIIQKKVNSRELLVVGAEYSLHSGRVEVFQQIER